MIDDDAAIAADPDASASERVSALARVVDALAIGATATEAIAARLAEAVDDLAVVDAAIATRRASVVCAALHALGPRADLATTRRRVVRRLVAARVTGLPLAGLALAIGDLDAGAALAADDFTCHVAPRLDRLAPDPIVTAFAHWLAALAAPAARAVIARVATDVEVLAAHATRPELAQVLVDLPG